MELQSKRLCAKFLCIVGIACLWNSPFAFAQEAEPDTVDWKRYFPMEIGNQWHYQYDSGTLARWYIKGDTLIADTSYFLLTIDSYDENGAFLQQSTLTLRYDTTHAYVIERAPRADGTFREVWFLGVPCGLNAPFNVQHECTGGTSSGTTYWVYGETNLSFLVGGELVQTFTKLFDSLTGVWYVLLDIGPVESPFGRLLYTHVGDVSYGDPVIPTDSNPRPIIEPFTRIESIYPSPTNHDATMTYHLAQPSDVSVEVYDSLGRIIYTEEVGYQGIGMHHAQLALSGLSSGQYYIRLVSPTATSSAQPITIIN